MRTVIVYESMFGNTHAIADAIARGLGAEGDVTVVPVGEASQELLSGADLAIVGGPTHVHGMSRANTRKAAMEQAHKPGSGLTAEAGADGPGLRDWFGSLGQLGGGAAAFDTRVDGPAAFTGRASKGIAKLLERHGLSLVAPAESFLVSKGNELLPGEEYRAEQWGRRLSARLVHSAGAGQPQ